MADSKVQGQKYKEYMMQQMADKQKSHYQKEVAEAIEYIEYFDTCYGDCKIDLKYFFMSSKLAVASEFLGDKETACKYAKLIKKYFLNGKLIKIAIDDGFMTKRLYFKSCMACLDILARAGDFDSFCLALEFYRPFSEQFYYPRRDILIKLGIIQDLQDLSDGNLDILAISMPQRVGKSRIGLFFLLFYCMINVDKEKQTFATGHSSGLMKSFYDEVLMYFSDTSTYRTFEIFSGHSIARKNADYFQIDIDKPKGMPNLVFRSIDSSVTGTVEGGLFMYVDDLIKEANEVINTEIADNIWTKFNIMVLGRMKNKVPLLILGTRWGINCPITRLQEYMESDDMFELGIKLNTRFRTIGCYDENGESNFNYKYGVGFDNQYYKKLELTLKQADPALWSAMYLAEPITRIGRPFQVLEFYDKLPERKPDYRACVVDVATIVGGDCWSCPMGLFYENEKEIYIDEVVYDNKGVDTAIPKTVEMILRHNPIMCEIEEKEATKGKIELGIAARIKKMLYDNGYRCNVNSHNASGEKSKRERILTYKPDIMGIETEFGWRVYFNKNRYVKDSRYRQFVEDIKKWSEDNKAQKKQADDSIDSIAQLIRYGTKSSNSRNHINLFSPKQLGL